MGELLENIYDVIFTPATAMRQIASRKPVGQAFCVFFLSVFIPAVLLYYTLKTAGFVKFLMPLILLQTVGGFLLWFGSTALLHLISEFFGGRGSAISFFAARGFSHIPRVFIVPLWVFAMLLPSTASSAMFALAWLMIAIWTLVLDIVAIKETYGLSGAKAVLILLTPWVAFGALLIIVAVFLSSALLPGHVW
jgi:hypothetical protein